MTLEIFLQAVFQVALAIVLASWAIVAVTVSTYYAYKTAQSMIKRRTRIIGKLKRSRWLTTDKAAIRMVKAAKNGR